MAQRSTSLKLVEKHCPAALDLAQAGTPMDRRIFQPGIAAHAILETIGKNPDKPAEAVADAVCRELVTHGRSFAGVPEPPMTAEAASAGREMALRFLQFTELSPTSRYEKGYAVGPDWQAAGYDSDAYYLAAIDVVDIRVEEDEEGYKTKILVVSDWKSAWPTSEVELETIQLRGQGCVALAHHPDATILRRQVVNLRTGQTFTADTLLDEFGQAEVARWRKDIDLAIIAADARGPDGKRPANPGANCMGCPYVLRCEPARGYYSGALGGDPESVAQAFAIADAVRSELFALAKLAATEEPIPVPGGVVGYVAVPERTVREDAGRTLAHRWFGVIDPETWDAENGRMLGFLGALKVGVGQIGAIGKALFPGKGMAKVKDFKDRRADLDVACLVYGVAAKFGVHRAGVKEETTEGGE